MATTTYPITLTTLQVGSLWLPQPQGSGEAIPDSASGVIITLDRTVPGGLNSLTGADTLTLTAFQSQDNGATWLQLEQAVIPGGVYDDKFTHQPITVAGFGADFIPGTSRLVALQVAVAGASIAVQGSLALS